jgi:hypothetical protein
MKWKTKSKIKEGERRTRKLFAFTTTELTDGNTVLWETYWALEEFASGGMPGDFWVIKKTWAVGN